MDMKHYTIHAGSDNNAYLALKKAVNDVEDLQQQYKTTRQYKIISHDILETIDKYVVTVISEYVDL